MLHLQYRTRAGKWVVKRLCSVTETRKALQVLAEQGQQARLIDPASNRSRGGVEQVVDEQSQQSSWVWHFDGEMAVCPQEGAKPC